MFLQASMCSDLIDPTEASLWIVLSSELIDLAGASLWIMLAGELIDLAEASFWIVFADGLPSVVFPIARRWIIERRVWPKIGLAAWERPAEHKTRGRRAASGAAQPVYHHISGSPPGRQRPIPRHRPALGDIQPRPKNRTHSAFGLWGMRVWLGVVSSFLLNMSAAGSEIVFFFRTRVSPE